MQLQAPQLLEPFAPAAKPRGNDAGPHPGDRSFWELLAERGPEVATKPHEPGAASDDEPHDPALTPDAAKPKPDAHTPDESAVEASTPDQPEAKPTESEQTGEPDPETDDLNKIPLELGPLSEHQAQPAEEDSAASDVKRDAVLVRPATIPVAQGEGQTEPEAEASAQLSPGVGPNSLPRRPQLASEGDSGQLLTIHRLNTRLLQADGALASQALQPKLSVRPTDSSGPTLASTTFGPGRAIEAAAQLDPAPIAVTKSPAADVSQFITPGQLTPDSPSSDQSGEPRSWSDVQAASRAGQQPTSATAEHSRAAVAATAVQSTSSEPAATKSPQSAPVTAAQAVDGAGTRKQAVDAHISRLIAHKPQRAGNSGATTMSERAASAVAAQALRGLTAAMNRSDGTVTLRLNPESMGFLRIRLDLTEGAVVARFSASNDQARQLLERSTETLRASLEAKGWESSQVRVELLREADPAAEMLKRLEQLGGMTREQIAAQDAPDRDGRGGDRAHDQLEQHSSSAERVPDASDDANGDPGAPDTLVGWLSGLDVLA